MQNPFPNRSLIIRRGIVAAAIILLIKVASLQVFDPSYEQQAEARTLDKQTLYPSRGLIYDRDGQLLVFNNPIYDINVIYDKIDPEMDTARFCELLDISREDFVRNLSKNWATRQYSKSVPFTFLRHVTPDRFAAFQESLYEFPGFTPVLRNVRGYRYPSAAHTLGYISEVDQATVETYEGHYVVGDYIGTSGIEKTYESLLKGQKGISYVLRDNLGREVGSISEGKLDSAAISGLDLQLSLDIELQQYAELLLRNKKGSIVCIEPATGEVLAMASAPGYDPSALTIHRYRGQAFSALQQDTLKPFFDRSVMAAYAPGSIFKPILALIAMQEHVLKPNRTIYCDGAYRYRHFSYGCHDHITPYNVSMALQHSCNSYFFQTFRDLVEKEGFNRPARGLTTLNNYLREFGLDAPLGIDLPHEKGGNVPGPEYYDKLYANDAWRSTYIMSLGIGQGELQLTTLQM
ncbi:MAG: penicillin-binding transpeptidase domain-containing protein, partial [Saprospiraceae bacterium]|nr:penicillin-binding transpeptidase domain-containing protein [Saprospiraceae bacterium]